MGSSDTSLEKEEQSKSGHGIGPFDFGGAICKIVVMSEEGVVALQAHEEVLRARSKFFEAALKDSWQSDEKGVVKLVGFTPDTVRRWLQCAYGGVLTTSETSDTVEQARSSKKYRMLSRLYVFGEYVQDRVFKLAVLSMFIRRMCEPAAAHRLRTFPGFDTISTIYEGTVAGSPARKMLADCYAVHGDSNWLIRYAGRYPQEFAVDLACALFTPPDLRVAFDEGNEGKLTEVFTSMKS